MEDTKKLLLITGINGFIASWTALRALQSGEYRVRGTVRDKTNEKKMNALKEALGEDNFNQIEFVNAELTDKASLVAAAEGVDYVLHMASPFPAKDPENEDEIVKPAVDGTVGILEAVKGTNVQRVVVTSSCISILEYKDGDCEVDEKSWPVVNDDTSFYAKSKIYAEKAAWDFIDKLKEDEKFELCTVNPGMVTGPVLNKSDGGSLEIFAGLMRGDHGSAPLVFFPVVDVRDVAEAHLKALTAKPFERYAMTAGTYKVSECGQMFYDEFGQYGYSCTREDMYKFTAWMAKIFVKDLRPYYDVWNIKCHVKNDKAKNELGIDFIPISESIKEMGYSLIKHGMVPDLLPK